uniref:Integrase, catalytic region, zinc finger, CCHC-type, peptidase aspartic, catalytic n=1 Tax=Tanacetum cinerariifolium TaxID=118510 RepID=A0A6L2N618_TANCI|nr:hypothetical protein [Tanacetum cinerariifolium]
MSAIASRFPPSTNQLKTSSNPKNQATIQDGRVTVQQVQGRQHQSYAGTRNRGIATTSKGNEKLMLAEAQEAGQILDEEQRAFLVDLGISKALVSHQTIPHNSAFQTDDLDAYDLDYDDLSSAKEVLMANFSSCDPEVLSKVPYSDSYSNDMINQDVQEMQYSEQTHVDDFEDNEIHSETLILKEESRSNMFDKQNDPISIENNIKISPIDYLKLNKIKEDFGKRFVTKKELFAEQDFWLKHSSFFETPVTSHTPVKIKAPSELSKMKLLKFKLFFNQMEDAVDQCFVDNNIFKIQIKQLRIDNDQLLNQIMSQEIMHIVVNSVDILDVKKSCVNECKKCLELEIELFKKKDFVEKEAYDKLVKNYLNLEKHCISLELATQLNQEIFQRENSALKNELMKIKGKNIVNTVVSKPNATLTPGMFKLDIEPISARLKNNRDAHEELLVYDSQTCPNLPKPSEKLVAITETNKEKIIRFAEPVTSSNNIPRQTDSLKTKDSNKSLFTSTGIKPTTSASRSKPSGNIQNNRIS